MKIFDIEVIYYEQECGYPCTPLGCPGHETNLPVGIFINGHTFMLEEYMNGDFPSSDKEYCLDVKETIEDLKKVLENGRLEND